MFFVLASVLGIPLSWHKTLGGDTLIWVGFELLLESYRVGISQRRADWFIRWSTEVASSPTIHMKTFEEGLGRIMFVAGALEHERPFLGPLHKFLTLHHGMRCQESLHTFLSSLTSCLEVYRSTDTTTAISSWTNRVLHRGLMLKRAQPVRVSAAGSRTSTRKVQSISGSPHGFRWRLLMCSGMSTGFALCFLRCRQAHDVRHHGRYDQWRTVCSDTVVAWCSRLVLLVFLLSTLCSLRLSAGLSCQASWLLGKWPRSSSTSAVARSWLVLMVTMQVLRSLRLWQAHVRHHGQYGSGRALCRPRQLHVRAVWREARVGMRLRLCGHGLRFRSPWYGAFLGNGSTRESDSRCPPAWWHVQAAWTCVFFRAMLTGTWP